VQVVVWIVSVWESVIFVRVNVARKQQDRDVEHGWLAYAGESSSSGLKGVAL
jgi:hypothetical protein